jgi:hypothetical protein
LTPDPQGYILAVGGKATMTERRSTSFDKPSSRIIPRTSQFGHNSSPVSDSDKAEYDHWQEKKAAKKRISSRVTPKKGRIKPHNLIPSSK